MKKRIASIIAALCLVVSSMTVLAETTTVEIPPTKSVVTIEKALEIGNSLENGKYLKDDNNKNIYYNVTGKIVEITNETTGCMYIADENNNKIYVYKLSSSDGNKTAYGDMATKPQVGDMVTISGQVSKYNNQPQLASGQLYNHTTASEPAKDTVLSITEANALAALKNSGSNTISKYYVTGKVVEVVEPTGDKNYGNMYIQDEAGNKLYVYGTYSEDGSTLYNDLEVKPVVGDTVILYGVLGNYKGTLQMKNAWLKSELPKVEEPTTEAPTTTQAPTTTAPTTTAPAGGNNGGAGAGTPSTADSSNVIVILAIACAAIAVAFAVKKQNA